MGRLEGHPELRVGPVAHGAASCHAQDGGGVAACGAVVVQRGVCVTEEEGQRHQYHGGQGAGELEAVEGFPVGVGEEHEDCRQQNTTDDVLTVQRWALIIIHYLLLYVCIVKSIKKKMPLSCLNLCKM